MSTQRDPLLRVAATQLRAARAGIDAALSLLEVAQSTAEPDEAPDTPAFEYPAFGGGGYNPQPGSPADQARRRETMINVPPLTRDLIRADATGAAFNPAAPTPSE